MADRIVSRWHARQPFSVLLELTYRCNLDCFYCYNDRSLAGAPLSLARYQALIDELDALNVFNLTLSGGEPLAHPDFFAIGSHARARGMVLRIKSNGHALGGRLARRVRDELDPFVIDISLHGASAATHDRQTRVPGSFARLMTNLDTLSTLGLRFKLNATITAWNMHELAAMEALAATQGWPLRTYFDVTQRDDGDQAPKAIDLASADKARLRARTPAPAGAGTDGQAALKPDTHCGAGIGAFTVDPVGNVLPCVQWRVPVGNLHHSSLGGILAQSAALAEVRHINERLGRHGQAAGYCPGKDFHGDVKAVNVFGRLHTLMAQNTPAPHQAG